MPVFTMLLAFFVPFTDNPFCILLPGLTLFLTFSASNWNLVLLRPFSKAFSLLVTSFSFMPEVSPNASTLALRSAFTSCCTSTKYASLCSSLIPSIVDWSTTTVEYIDEVPLLPGSTLPALSVVALA